ncbi:hypothetical protein A9K81_13685 [Pseudomonas syringae pv. syringae]|nr:hypothetical protein A9K81_13685 [Pseudomonas syringae pv. syringae]
MPPAAKAASRFPAVIRENERKLAFFISWGFNVTPQEKVNREFQDAKKHAQTFGCWILSAGFMERDELTVETCIISEQFLGIATALPSED